MLRRVPNHHLRPWIERHSHAAASVAQCCGWFAPASSIFRKQSREENQ